MTKMAPQREIQIATMTTLLWSKRHSTEKISVTESLCMLKDAGFRHFDLNLCAMGRNESEFCRDDWQFQADRVRNTAEKLGLSFVQSHAPYLSSPENLRDIEYMRYFHDMMIRSVTVSRMMGIDMTVVHPVNNPAAQNRDQDAHLRFTGEVYRDFLEACRKSGMRPAFENLTDKNRDGRFGSGAEDLIRICDFFRDCEAGVCWDFGHGHLSHDDECSEILKLKNRILCVHTHDNKGKNDDHLMPFLGNIDWERVLPAMLKTGFRNDLVLEVAQNANMPAEMRMESCRLCAHASELLIKLFRQAPDGKAEKTC